MIVDMQNNSSPLTCQRDLFDLEDGVISMITSSKSTLLKSSIDAGHIGVEAKGRPYLIDDAPRYIQADDIRARFARLIGASGDDIAIHPSAAYGIATAAKNLKPAKGSRILMLEGQFPSNVYAWQNLANETGAECVMVPWPEDNNWTQAVLDQIDARVSIAALPPCHWTDGTTLDLVQIGAALHEIGATFVVDATQWAGVIPIDVQTIHADFLVCAAYKWLLGPYGLSFFYAAPPHQNGQPIEEHLFNHGGVESISSGLSYPEEFTKGARRYDMGEHLNLITLPMIQQSLIQIEAWQPARISAYLAPITDAIASDAQAMGFHVSDTKYRCPHIIGIRRDGGFPADILTRLSAAKAYVSSRGGALRLSPYLYNTVDEAHEIMARIAKALD